jgi:muramoyltetrapeptide carboxypeptidase
MIKPNKLKKGDIIGVVSPSAPSAGLFPHRTESGIKMLEKLGFRVKVGDNALKVTDHTAGTPLERASDLNDMFADPEVKGIICFIGGNHSNQILDNLDFGLIRRNPKVFVGYSDATVLHGAIGKKTGLVTFYGPAALTQFAENPTINAYTLEYFERAVMSDVPVGRVRPSAEWTDEVLDWSGGEDRKRPRAMRLNPGWKWLIKGSATGPIMGGCITSLLHLRGTEFWPDFSGSILFWEIPESCGDFRKGESAGEIDAALTDLELNGVFSKIKGMIIGRPFGYDDDEKERLEAMVKDHVERLRIPVLFGADIGHTDPMITIPQGTEVRIDSGEDIFEFLERGTE